MQDDFTTLAVAAVPFLVLVIVPGIFGSLLAVVNHFFKLWDSHEKFLDFYLVVMFVVSFIIFIAFFFVVRGLEFCA